MEGDEGGNPDDEGDSPDYEGVPDDVSLARGD